jgi:hypothetical protein
MDLLAIVISALLSAVLFIVLEFSIILPLFRKIVTRAVDDMVQNSIIPKIQDFVHGEVTQLSETLTSSILAKISGFIGGRQKGVNAAMLRLASGEAFEDIEGDYKPSTIEQILNIVSAVADRVPIQPKENENNGKEENKQESSGPSLVRLSQDD